MKLKINEFLKLGILPFIVFLFIHFNNDYMENKIRKCTVLGKVQSPGKYSSAFYVILKDERGIVFDHYSSASSYYMAEKGQVKYYNLRDFDINQTPKDNIIFFIGELLFGVIGVILMLVGSIILIIDLKNKRV